MAVGPRFGPSVCDPCETGRGLATVRRICDISRVLFHVKQQVSRVRRSEGRPPLPVPATHGILRPDVAANSVVLRCRAGGRATLMAASPRIDPSDDPATRCGRRGGDGAARTDRRSVHADRGRATTPVLVLGVIVTIAVGLESGLVWAFVGGLALDVLAQRPLGSTAFALLLCVGGASVLGRSLARLRPIVPIGAVFVLSLGYSMILFAAFNALGVPSQRRTPSWWSFPGRSMTPPWPRRSVPRHRGPRSPARTGAGGLVNSVRGRPRPAGPQALPVSRVRAGRGRRGRRR